MTGIEDRIKEVALSSGADTCGIASVERMLDGPPSADPTYVMKEAQSVIAYTIAYDDDILADFMAKRSFVPFVKHKKELEIRLYTVGDAIAEYLTGLGHQAVVVSINAVYRPEPGVSDPSEAVAMIPDFSIRYATVAAGLGRIGWSGNVLTPEYGAAVIMCAVITSAQLKQDPLLEENPCDGCRSCVSSCPTSMIKHREGKTIRMFGLEDTIAEKRTNNACYMGCTDYHGLSADGKWSNWSPYREKGGFPEDDKAVDAACTSARKVDPVNDQFFNTYDEYRDFIEDPDALLFSSCGYCSYVCNGPSPKRNRSRFSILKSGYTVLRATGPRETVKDADAVVEVPTPLGPNIAMLKVDIEAVRQGKIRPDPESTKNIRDRQVLKMLADKGVPDSVIC